MNEPILVLQYLDELKGRLIALATTKDIRALRVFKEIVIEEAKKDALDFRFDEVTHLDSNHYLKRLQGLLDLLIPNGGRQNDGQY